MGNSIHSSMNKYRNSGWDWNRDSRTHSLFKLPPKPFLRPHWEPGRNSTSLITIQIQLDSLAVVVLQNRRGLDLLAAENRGPCLFLEDVRCFYTSKSGVVKKESESCSVVSHALQLDYSVHGILQARMLEWVAFPFSRGSSQPRDRTQASCIAGGFCTSWATEL